MYLKRLEMVGFKSFAKKTRLDFERGMTAVVGPNGCGKSNVCDAVRWVLGEQSAKALRGSKMEDVIFNGTDKQAALGMAEVSLTLTDCEGALGTDYSEVTITRRVFRSGEGQYFINQAACRLKDIQRLFMDTGVRTQAYSILEQGRIDRILSSRPEERREVFEEASGIVKYKADKKEALRKLDHTETNLQRLADVIREVRRQIISLQRQAGKAKRYQALMAELRAFDLYLARGRLDELITAEEGLGETAARLTAEMQAAQAELEQADQEEQALEAALTELENALTAVQDQAAQARGALDRARQLQAVNEERIRELEDLAARDDRDAREAAVRLEERKRDAQQLEAEREVAVAAETQTRARQRESAETLKQAEQAREAVRGRVEAARTAEVRLEARRAQITNDLNELDSRQRGALVRRERLLAEQAELERAAELFEERQRDLTAARATQATEVARIESAKSDLVRERQAQQQVADEVGREAGALAARMAGHNAQIELLTEPGGAADPMPEAARLLLERPDALAAAASEIVGTLADQIEAEPPYRAALEAVLRRWLEAVVVRDVNQLGPIIARAQATGTGRLTLLAAGCAAAPEAALPADGPGEALWAHVRCAPAAEALLQRILAPVRVWPETMPWPTAPQAPWILVSTAGVVLSPDGSAEWQGAEGAESNPLARKHALLDRQRELDTLREQGAGLERRRAAVRAALEQLAGQESALAEGLAAAQRVLAMTDGELRVVEKEVRQARERAGTVAWELKALIDSTAEQTERRQTLQGEIEKNRDEHAALRAEWQQAQTALQDQEKSTDEAREAASADRLAAAEAQQEVAALAARLRPALEQIASLEQIIAQRERGVAAYRDRIVKLATEREEAAGRIAPLEAEIAARTTELTGLHTRRDARRTQRETLAARARVRREALEGRHEEHNRIEVQRTEQRMRRQALEERLRTEYRLGMDELAREPEPEWGEETPPERETLETRVAELRAIIEGLGPVNLIAIEEYQELEERYAFLTHQQEDLVNAKQQLLEMIRKINRTTTELFTTTFNQVNENFQIMFKQLFGGGSAKLVLLDEQEVLESGIEIIARPPGKKLQTVSLLSGGERTLAAVALLFALYLVKPSPFCVLDELDAALDDANIGRFVDTVKSFLDRSQFILITHSRRTIAACDILYGVTMEERGISRIVSVKLSEHPERAEPRPPVPEDTPDAEGVAAEQPET